MDQPNLIDLNAVAEMKNKTDDVKLDMMERTWDTVTMKKADWEAYRAKWNAYAVKREARVMQLKAKLRLTRAAANSSNKNAACEVLDTWVFLLICILCGMFLGYIFFGRNCGFQADVPDLESKLRGAVERILADSKKIKELENEAAVLTSEKEDVVEKAQKLVDMMQDWASEPIDAIVI